MYLGARLDVMDEGDEPTTVELLNLCTHLDSTIQWNIVGHNKTK